MFAITGFYHRYFSHRAFRTSRARSSCFALLGASAVQRGPLWWAAHHRHHHAHADTEPTRTRRAARLLVEPHAAGSCRAATSARDRARACATSRASRSCASSTASTCSCRSLLAALLFRLGGWLERFAPALGTNGAQLLVWGFFVSTVVLFHATFTINSLAHRFGTPPLRRRATTAATTALLALLTFGEGWHNNHHHYPGAARQGFYWWEIDLTCYVPAAAWRAMGIVWDLREPSPRGRTPSQAHPHRAQEHAREDRHRRQRHRRHRRGATALHRAHDVTVFEADDHVGGHTHTHRVELGGREYAVDTGFIVFNDCDLPALHRAAGRARRRVAAELD